MATDIEDFYVDNSSEYMDIDEEDIDWNERILEMEEEPEETESEDDPDAESDEESDEVEELDDSEDLDDTTANCAVDKSKFRRIKLTDKYISQQLTLSEFMRDRIRFRYKGEPMYGHIVTITKSGKYWFDVVDLKTGKHSSVLMNGEFIDNY